MKIQNIISEQIGDDLPHGWSQGDPEERTHESIFDKYKITYKLYQKTISSPTRGGLYEPPNQQHYLGEVIKVHIDTLVYLPSNYDVDVDLDLGYPFHKDDLMEFVKTLETLGEQFNPNERDEYNKFIGYPIHNNPQLSINLLKAIEIKAEQVYTGEI